MDAGEPVRQPLELAPGLQLGFGGQVHARVAPHVHQAALDPRSRPRLPARRAHAAQPVRYQHVGRGDSREQGYVGGPALMRAPPPAEHLPAVPVDRDDQAPAVRHVRAVRHHRVVLRRHGRRRGADVPAPGGPLAQGPRVAGGIRQGLRAASQQPTEEPGQLPFPLLPLPVGDGARRARRALPPLAARRRPAVLLHRSSAYRAQARPARLRPHTPMQRTRAGRNQANQPDRL